LSNEIQKSSEINLLKSEVEAAAARVFERAANNTLDGASSFVGDVFGGLVGDSVKQWRTRRLVAGLHETKQHLEKLGVPLENAKSLPIGDLFAIFDGMSKQEDPYLTSMWAGLLANAMNPDNKLVMDPSLPKILEQMSGVDAVILKFYHDAFEERQRLLGKNGRITYGTAEDREAYTRYIRTHGDEIISFFGEEIASSSISNLLRLGLLFVESSLDHRDELVTAELVSDNEISVETRGLKEQLSNIYYHLNLSYDNVDDHKILNEVTFFGGGKTYYLPYDLTRLSKRLVKACA
jgi:hypothetical protein